MSLEKVNQVRISWGYDTNGPEEKDIEELNEWMHGDEMRITIKFVAEPDSLNMYVTKEDW